MGQKVNPHGMRVGVIKDWNSRWYADKSNFADFLVEDNKIRTFLKKKLTPTQIKNLCTKGKTTMIKGFVSKNEKKFNAILSLENGKLKFNF